MDGFKLSPQSELLFRQAELDGKSVHVLDNGMIYARGEAKLYLDQNGKIMCNIRTKSGAWVRNVPYHRVKLDHPEE